MMLVVRDTRYTEGTLSIDRAASSRWIHYLDFLLEATSEVGIVVVL
jgi:hypothetical protein